jgi:hypothetical protein
VKADGASFAFFSGANHPVSTGSAFLRVYVSYQYAGSISKDAYPYVFRPSVLVLQTADGHRYTARDLDASATYIDSAFEVPVTLRQATLIIGGQYVEKADDGTPYTVTIQTVRIPLTT